MNDTFAADRSLRVGPDKIVKTAWVHINRIVMANRDRMAVGDVDRAFQKVLQRGPCGGWPPPVGYWDEDQRFVITDGRHEFIATLMLGHEKIFVAWIEAP